jgi:hypothetical protein
MIADPIPNATAKAPIRPTWAAHEPTTTGDFAGATDRSECDGKSSTDIRDPPTIPAVWRDFPFTM